MKLRADRLRGVVIVLAVVLVVLAVVEQKWAVYGLLGLLVVVMLAVVVRWLVEPAEEAPPGGG